MQTQQTKRAQVSAGPPHRGRLNRLLLIGSDAAFSNNTTRRVFNGQQFRIAGRSTTLLDALARLESSMIDLVLLSREFGEEELSLFLFDAHRRGFAGLILQVASVANEISGAAYGGNAESSDKQFGSQNREVGSRIRALVGSSERHRLYTKGRADMPARSELCGPHNPVSFSPKQQAVLMWVSEGWTNQQIASHLQCSEGSVKAALQELFNKLGVRKRAQIVRMAFDKTQWRTLNDVRRGKTQSAGHDAVGYSGPIRGSVKARAPSSGASQSSNLVPMKRGY
jgi:DNA-binding NarL/FixJ family response regulator